MYSPKISFIDSSRIMGALLLMATLMHGLNVLLASKGVQNANYFWTMVENGRANNTLLALFASVIPVDFFYLLFALPIFYAYMGFWNLQVNLARRVSHL